MKSYRRRILDDHTGTGPIPVPVGRRHFFGELALRADLGTMRAADFENRQFFVPERTAAYMTRLYGPNYMTPPPESARERHVVFEPLVLPCR